MVENDGIELLTTLFYYFILPILLPGYLLFANRGAVIEGQMTSYVLFAILPLGVLFIIFARIYIEREGGFYEAHPELEALSHFSIHAPEKTLLGRSTNLVGNPGNLFAASLMISMFLGMTMAVSGSFLAGTPALLEQGSVSPLTQVGLGVEPAVSSETLFFNVGVFYTVVTGVFYLLTRQGIRKQEALITGKIIGVLLTTLLFLLWHNFVLTGQQVSQIGILLLGFLTTAGVAVTGSIIFAYVLHFVNNLFVSLLEYNVVTSETAVLIAVITSLMSGIYLFVRNT